MMTRTSSLVPWPNIKKYGNMEIYDDDDFFSSDDDDDDDFFLSEKVIPSHMKI